MPPFLLFRNNQTFYLINDDPQCFFVTSIVECSNPNVDIFSFLFESIKIASGDMNLIQFVAYFPPLRLSHVPKRLCLRMISHIHPPV